MLTELKLSNFRIFDDEVSVRFRPITVLIGRNSSGKSSIIKFLLMLQQSMDPGRSQFLTAEGDRVNLGVFAGLKNSLTRKRSLTFELAVRSIFAGVPNRALSRYLESLENVDFNNLQYKTGAEVSYSRRVSIGQVNYSLLDGAARKSLLTARLKILDDSSFADYPTRPEILEARPGQEDSEERGERFRQLMDRRLASIVRHLAEVEIVNTIGYVIDSMRHLSPVREESQRVILASLPPKDNVGQRGQFTLPHLQEIIAEHPKRYEFILPHLRSVAGIESIRFRRSLRFVSQALAKSKATGAEVLIADYGFGVSQCLPIFVQGAIMAPYTSLMVEQPEAQLHPTAQLELGSFFADLWNKRKVGSIIETHSDNILLRLRRLIARSELSPEDVSVAFFTFDEENSNMPIIKNLDINEDGSMEAGLPLEFFGANVIEGLRLGAKA